MTPAAAAWLALRARVFLRRWFGRAPMPAPATVQPVDADPTWYDELVPWDVAAETGEFTHILKSGTVVLTISKAWEPAS